MSGFLLDSYPSGSTIYANFHSFDSNGASITLTGLAVTDIEIYKNGSVTQRSSDNGYALLDTDGIDFDGITGIHGISIDLSDNSDASFYTIGAQFTVVLSSVTIDTRTVNLVLGSFRIAAAESSSGTPKADVSHFGGTDGTFSSGRPEVNTTHAAGTAWGSGAITAASIATGAIDADAIADNAIDAGAIASDAITAAKIATGALTAAKFAAGAIDAAALAADAGTEIGTAVWATAARTLTALDEDSTTLDLDATIRAAVGMASANLDTQLTAIDDLVDTEVAAIKTVVDSILVDTAEIGAAGAGLTVLATQASVNTIDDFLDTEVAAIKAKTDQLTFGVANTLNSNVTYVNETEVTGNGETGSEWGPA
jgi:hypothetical protein